MCRMGSMQIKRWLSFLPAAFVVYILLSYLVYQPNIQDTHSTFIGPSSTSSSRFEKINFQKDKIQQKASSPLHQRQTIFEEQQHIANNTQTILKTTRIESSPLTSMPYKSEKEGADKVEEFYPAEQSHQQPIVRDGENDEALTPVHYMRSNVQHLIDEADPKDNDIYQILPVNERNRQVEQQSFMDDNFKANENTNALLFPHSGAMDHLVKRRIIMRDKFVRHLNRAGGAEDGQYYDDATQPVSNTNNNIPIQEIKFQHNDVMSDSERPVEQVLEKDYSIMPSGAAADNTEDIDSPTWRLQRIPDVISDPPESSQPLKVVPNQRRISESSLAPTILEEAASNNNNQQSIIIPRELLEDKEYKKKDENSAGITAANSSSGTSGRLEVSKDSDNNAHGGVTVQEAKNPVREPVKTPEKKLLQNVNSQETKTPTADASMKPASVEKRHAEVPVIEAKTNNVAEHSEVQSVKSLEDSKSKDSSVKPPVSNNPTRPKPPVKVKNQVVEAKGSVSQPRQSVVKAAASTTGHAINSLKGKVTIGEKYEQGFTTPHEELCPNNGRDLKVLILITTAPDHEKHRNAVRQTWGHFSMRRDVAISFVVGRTSRTEIQNLIDKENDRYGDIIEANFIDHYSNLTLKTVSMFEWSKTYCSEAKFVLKTDDDMFINVPLLLAFISAKKNEKNAIFGRLAKGWKPVRNKKSKYFIDTNTYSRVRYPDFLTGPAYLFTSDVVDKIYQSALNTSFFFLEDVLLTGFVGESLGIKRVGDSHFRNEKISLTDTCKLMQSISIHMVKYEEQFDIYKRTLDGKTKCKTR